MTEPTVALANRRVLIVEDEALLAFDVENECRELGCTDTYIAYHARQALDALEEFRPDFAILDVTLTDVGTDYELADKLADRGIPFVFASGHLAGELPDRHVGRPFVGKPMQKQDFLEAVQAALR